MFLLKINIFHKIKLYNKNERFKNNHGQEKQNSFERTVNYLFISRGIKDSDNIFRDLSENQFKNLYELDISDNNLTKLPSDLSIFDNLNCLDVTNNPFESVRRKK